MNKEILELELKKINTRVSHGTHLVMTLLTGVWIIVWIFAVINKNSKVNQIDKDILKAKIGLVEN